MMHSTETSIPGPRGIPLLGPTGSLLRFFRDPIRCMRDLHEQYGDVAAVSANDASLVCAFGADINRQVLSSPDLFHTAAELPIKIPKGSSLDRLTTFLVGMNGDEHKRLRRAMSPLFQKGYLESYRSSMVVATESVLSRLQPGAPINLSATTAEIALCVAFRCLFGVDVSAESRSLAKTALDFTDGATSLKLMIAPLDLPGSPYRRFLRLSERLEARLLELIAERRNDSTPRSDALSVLMNASDEAGATLPDSTLVGLANELFIAGHDTTACTLAWTIFLLERHPEIYNRLQEELAFVLKGEAATLSDLERLPVLDGVVKESMRLLSATPFLFFRKSIAGAQIGGLNLPAGSKLVISPLMTHRVPELYKDPERFLPERWETLQPGPYEYLPFGAGPRMCLGAAFATLSLRVILSMTLQRYRFSCPAGAAVSYKVRGVILGAKDGIPMNLSRPERSLVRAQPIRGNISELVALS
jgi:cytochrome P450